MIKYNDIRLKRSGAKKKAHHVEIGDIIFYEGSWHEVDEVIINWPEKTVSFVFKDVLIGSKAECSVYKRIMAKV